MITKNKCGYELLEYIPCDENEIINYKNVTGAGVVYKVGNKYLIGFNDWRMQWELPVGGIEEGESAKQAAIRELFEETHQKVEDVEFKGLFKKKRPKGEIIYTAIFFCEKDGIVPFVKNDADENIEIPGDLSGMVYTTKDNWEFEMLKELNAAGMKIDMNKLLS